MSTIPIEAQTLPNTNDVPLGYKRTEVGVIPGDWQVTTLGELGRCLSGGTPRMSDSRFWGGDIPWVSSKDMKVSRLHDAIDHVTELALSNGTRLIYPGSILMVVRGMSLAHSFPVALVERSLSFNQDLKAFVPHPGISSEFVLRWLQANQTMLLSLATDSTHGTKRMPTSDLLNSYVALPPITEQRAIAAALGDVDALITSLDALISKKRAVKQATMQQLLTGTTRLPGFSREWEVKRLGDLSEMGSGGTPPSSNPDYYDGDIPWVSISDMTKAGKTIVVTDRNLSRTGLVNSAAQIFPVGTVLYAMYASLGECSIADISLCSSQAILGIRPKVNLNNEFLYYYLDSLKSKVKSIGQQGTQSNLNKGMVQAFELRLPSLKEQTAIAAVLADMDAEIAALEAQRSKTQQIKQGMMQQLLTGRIRLA